MTRDELKSIVRNGAHIEATLADLNAELSAKRTEVNALQQRHDELTMQMTQVAVARAELGEPTPDPKSAAKPKK